MNLCSPKVLQSKKNIEMIIFLGLFLILISGASEGIMDSIQFHFERTPFYKFKNQKFWNPGISWRNKWKNGDPSQGERFRFSSTFLVSLTDAWHLFKMLRNIGIFISIPLISYQSESPLQVILFALCLRIVYGIGFRLMYK